MEKKNFGLESNILLAIEQMWGYSLPKDYRKFLLKFNGGIVKKKVFYFDKMHSSVLNVFFGIVCDFNDNILLKQKYSGNRCPDDMLPIAADVYGNMILIRVKNKERGEIYFWDHEREGEEGRAPTYDNIVLINKTFDEFINSLKSE